MCVDLSRLNKYVQRERYQTMTPAQAVADIAASDAKYFTVLDAMKGYHQCALDRESQLLTTFITPFGRFKYLRAPYGISSISEHYDRRMAEAFTGLTGFRRIVYDIVIYDSDASTHTKHVRTFLKRCADKNIALDLAKCKFHQTKVTFAEKLNTLPLPPLFWLQQVVWHRRLPSFISALLHCWLRSGMMSTARLWVGYVVFCHFHC